MNPVCLSWTSLSLFLDCPRCFWLDKVQGKKRPAGIFPSLPNGMDRILKEHFDQHRKDGLMPEELHGKFQGELFQDKAKLDAWRDWRKGLRWTDKETGFSLTGALDDLFITNDGRYAPLDFKTRGSPRKDETHEYYERQMDIYAFLLEKADFTPADFAILIFYHPVKVDDKHNVEFAPDPVKVHTDGARGEKLFREAVACLCGEEPKAKDGCLWCGW